MSSGPSTFGSMITSRRSPTSLTAAVDVVERPRRIERVDTRPQLGASCGPGSADLDQAGTGRFLVARRNAVLEVGHAARRPSGRSPAPSPPSSGSTAGGSGSSATDSTGISRSGSGAPTASGRKKSFGGRIGVSERGPPQIDVTDRRGRWGRCPVCWHRVVVVDLGASVRASSSVSGRASSAAQRSSAPLSSKSASWRR